MKVRSLDVAESFSESRQPVNRNRHLQRTFSAKRPNTRELRLLVGSYLRVPRPVLGFATLRLAMADPPGLFADNCFWRRLFS